MSAREAAWGAYVEVREDAITKYAMGTAAVRKKYQRQIEAKNIDLTVARATVEKLEKILEDVEEERDAEIRALAAERAAAAHAAWLAYEKCCPPRSRDEPDHGETSPRVRRRSR